jgi:hypothetical protein
MIKMNTKLCKILSDFKSGALLEDETTFKIHELFAETEVLPNEVMNYLAMSGAWLYDLVPNDNAEVKEKLKRMNETLLNKYE